MIISLIAALTQNRVIGKNNDLPWRLPDDMKYFMKTTTDHHVIMGRKNYQSLPPNFKPLPKRTNIVVTHQHKFKAEGCQVVNSIEAGIGMARKNNESELFIIGGAQIYKQALPLADRLYLTEIKASVDGDTYFPEFDKDQWKEASRIAHSADEKHSFGFDFVVYKRKA